MLRAKVEAEAALRDAIAEAVRRKATTPLDEAIRVHSPAAQGIIVQHQPQHHLECHLNRLHWTYSGVGRILNRYCINDQVMFSSWPLKQAHAMRRTLKAQARRASGRDRMTQLFRRLVNELKRPPVLALLVLAFLPQVAQSTSKLLPWLLLFAQNSAQRAEARVAASKVFERVASSKVYEYVISSTSTRVVSL